MSKLLTCAFPILLAVAANAQNRCEQLFFEGSVGKAAATSTAFKSGIIEEVFRNVNGKIFRMFRMFSYVTSERVIKKYGSAENVIRLLSETGYVTNIATNLLSHRPDIVYQILKARQAGLSRLVRPTTVYRVLRLNSVDEFNANHGGNFHNQTFVGTSVANCLWQAHGNHKSNVTLVLEVQVPNFLLRNPIIGLSGKYLGYGDVPDLSPFINRVGEVKWIDRSTLEHEISWEEYQLE